VKVPRRRTKNRQDEEGKMKKMRRIKLKNVSYTLRQDNRNVRILENEITRVSENN
jgi:hypothetical protein